MHNWEEFLHSFKELFYDFFLPFTGFIIIIVSLATIAMGGLLFGPYKWECEDYAKAINKPYIYSAWAGCLITVSENNVLPMRVVKTTALRDFQHKHQVEIKK